MAEVQKIIQQYHDNPDLSVGNNFDSFDTLATGDLWKKKNPPQADNKWLDIDKQFSESFTLLTRLNTVTSLAWTYLLSRGFDHIDELAQCYDLAFSTTGNWGYRIIIPVYVHDRMVTWTGRSIKPNHRLRYKSLSTDNSQIPIRDTILNYDGLNMDGSMKLLAITEGPLDALKLDFYGRSFGLRATCLFSNSLSPKQAVLLNNLRKRFGHFVLAWDEKSMADMSRFMRVKESLEAIKPVEVLQLPKGVDDPGDLTAKQARRVCKKVLSI